MSSHLSLPIEVVEKIISESWSSPLSTDERITLMISSTLVNKAWSSIFTRISFTDVHIPCPSYLPRFFRLTRIESLYTRSRSPRELLCRSIHLSISNPHTHPPGPGLAPAPTTPTLTAARARANTPAMAPTLSELIFVLSAYPGGFPRLRTLSLAFHNLAFHDVLAHHRFFRFPTQVTRLEVRFSFAPHTPPWLVRALRADETRRGCLYPFVPSVRSLVVLGASEAFVRDMVGTCRGLESLEVDFPDGSAVFGAGEKRLMRVCEVGGGVGERGLEGAVLPVVQLVIAGSCEGAWRGAKVGSESDIYKFRRVRECAV
ncbi:hypothetical protein BDZ94DRAFT_1376238 [Collybia nuda]|uniref:F-box domain-containing protein n=1 Tax=Collybia nuda TaxID=64659 RepID=A0A9P6CCE7_9AGAR|nr:hypothetical protein BDZ94DRAFT_1376238 [Collybia nuda]